MNPAHAKKILEAKEKITPEGAWTQYVYARHEDGREIYWHSPAAAKWCAIGAIRAVNGDHLLEQFLSDVTNRRKGMPVHRFNDSHTHGEVLSVFDEAYKDAMEAKNIALRIFQATRELIKNPENFTVGFSDPPRNKWTLPEAFATCTRIDRIDGAPYSWTSRVLGHVCINHGYGTDLNEIPHDKALQILDDAMEFVRSREPGDLSIPND